MLSSVLKSERAVKVNIAIMRAFVKLRETLETNRELARKFAELEKRVGKHDEEIAAIIDAIRQLMAPPEKPRAKSDFMFARKRRVIAPETIDDRLDHLPHVRRRAPAAFSAARSGALDGALAALAGFAISLVRVLLTRPTAARSRPSSASPGSRRSGWIIISRLTASA